MPTMSTVEEYESIVCELTVTVGHAVVGAECLGSDSDAIKGGSTGVAGVGG